MPITFTKPRKPAQRGKTLERWVQGHLEKLAALKGYIWLRPDAKFRRSLGIYTDKQPADFLLLAGDKGIWFIECKETSDAVWYPERAATDYQRESIRKAQAMGYNAGFLVWFRMFGAHRWITEISGSFGHIVSARWEWEKFYE